jgi:DNA repair protein RecO (recombination protein O)
MAMQQRERKTLAVILHTTEIFDADRSYLSFTRDFGKIRARARGVAKPGSRLAGHLLAYLPCQLELIDTNGWYLIAQAQSTGEVREYPKHSLDFLQQCELIAEVIDKMLPDREPHPEVYDGLVYTLDRLQELCQDSPDEGALLLVTAEFLYKMQIVMGYRPELERCVITGEPVVAENLAWSSDLGGVISEEGAKQARSALTPLAFPRTIVVLRQLARPEFVAERLGMDEAMRAETCRIIFNYLQTQIGKPLKSYSFLERM